MALVRDLRESAAGAGWCRMSAPVNGGTKFRVGQQVIVGEDGTGAVVALGVNGVKVQFESGRQVWLPATMVRPA